MAARIHLAPPERERFDAGTGAVVWSRMRRRKPARRLEWGREFAAGGRRRRFVAVSGHLVFDPPRLPALVGPARGVSYSSPQLATIGELAQVLLLSSPGVAGSRPPTARRLKPLGATRSCSRP
jgi:hypothetical protein